MQRGIIEFSGFEKKSPSMIMVFGIGGAGCNAVNHMINLGVENVSFVACNTDIKSLRTNLSPNKIQLGKGLGAGNNPEKARNAAIEQLDNIIDVFKRENTQVVFITAGMGGGTGTGASSIIAKAAHSLGILTIAIVSLPLRDEGPKRTTQAIQGLVELQEEVDGIIIIHNDNIPKIYGDLPMREAMHKADDILASAAISMAELITRHDEIAVDLEDVKTVMLNSGITLMGTSSMSGENRIDRLVEGALNSPLLNHQDIKGARKILLHITYGSDSGLTMSETTQILKSIQNRVGSQAVPNLADIIWGAGEKEELGDAISLTIIATGFNEVSLYSNEPISEKTALNEDNHGSGFQNLILRGKKLVNEIFSDTLIDPEIN